MLRSWFSGWKLHLILIEWCTLSWVEWCDFDASRYLKKKTQNREEANRIIGLLMKLVIFSQLKFKRLKEVLKEQSYQTQIKEIWRDNPKQIKPPQGYLPNHAILFLFFFKKFLLYEFYLKNEKFLIFIWNTKKTFAAHSTTEYIQYIMTKKHNQLHFISWWANHLEEVVNLWHEHARFYETFLFLPYFSIMDYGSRRAGGSNLANRQPVRPTRPTRPIRPIGSDPLEPPGPLGHQHS